MRKMFSAAAAAAAITVATPAAAVTVDFSASNFTNLYGTGTPVGAANGSLSYNYNGSVLTLTAFTLDIGPTHYGLGDLVTSLSGGGLSGPVNGTSWALSFGYNGAPNAYNETSALYRDFYFNFFFNPQTGVPSGSGTMLYTTGGTLQTGSTFHSSNVTVTSDAQIGAVPEPATWGMMLVGFGGIGFQMRRRKKASRPVFA